jgi:hypothetical protein
MLNESRDTCHGVASYSSGSGFRSWPQTGCPLVLASSVLKKKQCLKEAKIGKTRDAYIVFVKEASMNICIWKVEKRMEG